MLHLFRDRRRTKLIWIAVAGGTIFTFLIGFNFLFGTGAGSENAGTSASLGSVYGQPVGREEYQLRLSRSLENYRQRAGREMDDASLSYVRDQTWNQLLVERVMTAKARKLGLKATDAEVVFAVRNLPPQDILQAPVFQTNGQFDPAKYRQALEDPNQSWVWLEQMQREALPQWKLRQLTTSMGRITDTDLVEAYARNREKAQVVAVLFPNTASPVKPEEVTRPDLEAYYKKHEAEFRREREASLVLVVVPKVPTPSDLRSAEENARSLYAEAVKDTNFARFASQVSDAQVGSLPSGEPGVLVEKGQLPRELDGPVFGMAAGQVLQPIQVPGAWHIVKYVGPVQDQGKEKRHIIDLQVAVKAGEESLTRAHEQLNAVREAAAKQGLQAAATKAGLKPAVTGWFSEESAPPLLMQVPELVSFGVNFKKGTLTQVLEKPSALLLAQVSDRRNAGQRSLAEVEPELRTRVAQEKSVDRSEVKAREFMAQAPSGSIEESARQAGASVVGPVEFTRNGPFPPALQYEPEVVGSAFGYAPGSTHVVRGSQGAFVLRVLNRFGYDMEKFQQEAPQFRSQLTQERQQEYGQALLKKLMKDARVQDLRAEVGF
ncbi:MAG: SurA N-terminal domain-containing protein [Candidatus Eisenbacteria bacterium]|nr:SurA N-terminal domain-containing protein [Candidatus Eisenbacteria bacterium]